VTLFTQDCHAADSVRVARRIAARAQAEAVVPGAGRRREHTIAAYPSRKVLS
jgi:hypothetical protein